MSPTSHSKLLRLTLLLLTAGTLLAVGCSSSMNASMAGPTGSAFVVGTDAPMAAVTSFLVQVNSIDAIDAKGDSVPLLGSAQTVDFAQYNGLQTLLAAGKVTAGTYTSIRITLGSGTIGYLDTSTGGAPTIKTEAATFTTSTVNLTLPKPLVVVHAGAPVGLRVEFNLAKSIQVNSSGQITGQVDPVFTVKAVGEENAEAHIDDLVGSVVSVNLGAQSFIVQQSRGLQITVDVSSQTDWDGGASLSTLKTGDIVKVSGDLGSSVLTLNADGVTLFSTHGFYANGLVTYVHPASGAATSFDLYVSGVQPANTGVQLGQIAQVNLTGSEQFHVAWMHGKMSQYLFNSSTMLAGQNVAIGGAASGAANANAVSVNRVMLRSWGFNGTVVAGSVNASAGSFQMMVNGFDGVLIPQAVTVYIEGETEFRDGFTAMTDVGDSSTNNNVRVVGLLFRDATSGKAIILAHFVDDMQENQGNNQGDN